MKRGKAQAKEVLSGIIYGRLKFTLFPTQYWLGLELGQKFPWHSCSCKVRAWARASK